LYIRIVSKAGLYQFRGIGVFITSGRLQNAMGWE
jgi:hypothetical protein